MNLVSYIVKKYLRFDKSQPFISITAILAFLGVMVGVMVLIIAMAIMSGMSKEFEKRLFTMNYPLTIYPKIYGTIDDKLLNKLETNFTNLKFSPYIKTQVLLKENEEMNGGILFGVDFKREKEINEVLAKAIKDIDTKFPLIIGKGLFDELLINEGQKVTLIFTDLTPSGFNLIPKIKKFEVVGNFQSGLIAYDKGYFYTDMSSLQKVLNSSNNIYSGIHIHSNKPFEDIKKLQEFLGPKIGVVGWWQQNGNFFAAFEMEKRALFIVLMLIILVASLNIISSLLMTVMSRRKEIALLLSLGASKIEIKKIFLYLGLIIGGSGIVFGVVLGLFGLFLLQNFDIISIPADVYGTSHLPTDLSLIDFISIIIGSIIIITISSFYPAKKASEIDILNVLRNE